MIELKSFSFNPFQENTWLVWNENRDCVIIDPGCESTQEEKKLLDFISSSNLKPIAIWLTHCHIDHVLGLNFCLQQWQIPYFLHQKETAQLRAVQAYAPSYGFHGFQMPELQGKEICEGEIQLGNEKFSILDVPGHSPGHVAFYHEESGILISGDVLFRESIGRTDLPGGDFKILEQSIRQKIYTLPADTRILPGHGPETTVGHEMKFNPFVPA